ncbi:MAG: hypothetical protein S4CHLAM45_06780 [Chlamydiales bacterium]|nr:hypothetical protein [Chlamydiales bacterium]MCH9620304.1 hypothetical protein [Chlamydiales bacterium]MCH9622785.1 hypothetical protein [Chlamydiales bacterium]
MASPSLNTSTISLRRETVYDPRHGAVAATAVFAALAGIALVAISISAYCGAPGMNYFHATPLLSSGLILLGLGALMGFGASKLVIHKTIIEDN